MKRLIFFLLLISCVKLSLDSQTVLNVNGQAFTAQYTASNTTATTFSFTNNSLILSGAGHYGLLSGAESTNAYDNNLDGATITGNVFALNGTDPDPHGIMLGFNKNQIFRNNHVSNATYGVVYKSSASGVANMTDATGMVAYNVFRNNIMAIRVKGMNGVKIYNNTFYNVRSGSNAQIYITNNPAGSGGGAYASTGTKIKNNIFYITSGCQAVWVEAGCESGFECDYNIYYCNGSNPTFAYSGSVYNWSQWQAQGFDAHSVVMNPNFNNTTDLLPVARLNYGTNLGTTYQTGLSTSATWTVGSAPATADQNGSWQVGARVYAAAGSSETKGAYYVSTTGSDSNDGSYSNPWRTWQYAFNQLHAGDLLYVRGGIYNVTTTLYASAMNNAVVTNSYNSGTASDHITVENYPGETPILNCTGLTGNNWKCGLNIYGVSYWDIKGLIVQGVPTGSAGVGRGIGVCSSSNIVITQCIVRYCGDGFFTLGFCDPVYWIFCDSYSNDSKDYDNGDFCNGWTCGGYGSSGQAFHYYITGCRAWRNSDDGFDFLNADNQARGGYIYLANCWAFRNGYGVQGNGVGFKMGGWINYSNPNGGIQRTLTNCLAWYNSNNGFDENVGVEGTCYGASMDCALYNCVAYRNNPSGSNWIYGFVFSYAQDPNHPAQHILRNNIAYLNGYGQANTPSSKCTTSNNTWNTGFSVSASDFLSLDTTGVSGPRQADGSPPELNFLKLASTSVLIDAGVDVGLTYIGTAPDLGAYEYGTPSLPTVTTSATITVSYNSASVSGTVTSEGGGTVTARGFCYGTSINPSLVNSYTSNGSGLGTFIATLTGLVSGTTYHVRAYATSSAGTAYGTDRSFLVGSNSQSIQNGVVIKNSNFVKATRAGVTQIMMKR